MRNSTRRLALAASAVLALAAGGAALAQVPPPPPAPPAPPAPPLPPLPPMEMMAGGEHMIFMGGPGRHRDPEARAQHLRDVLQLRADQDGVLKAYLDATAPKIVTIKRDAGDKDAPGKDGPDKLVERKPPTTLERLDHMTKAAEAMQKRASATRTFYLALSPSQQKAFDALDLEIGGPGNVSIRRFETRHEGGKFGGKPGERRVIIQRKVG